MGKQSEIFRQSEAKAWLKRNEHKLPPQEDPVIDAIAKLKITPRSILEIGCANGWRLDRLRQQYQCSCDGVDPCITDPRRTISDSYLMPGTAERLPIVDPYDVIIYGYCLYLCDPEDYFLIAQQSDAILLSGGYLVIYDFHTTSPYSRSYAHQLDVRSRKMDFARLWLGHPFYSMISRDVIGQGDDRTAVTVLRKNIMTAFPVQK